jgi:hypothetical protein
MQEPSQAPGTWRIGFDLAAFVLLATIAGMAAAVTLASIALVLSGAVSSTPATASGAPVTIPGTPATTPGAPTAVPAAPAEFPGAPATAPDAHDLPGPAPAAAHTQVARSGAGSLNRGGERGTRG